MQVGKPVEEVLARRVGAVMGAPVAGKVLAGDVRRGPRPEIGAGTKPPADAGQHDHPDVRVVVAGAHVFADLGHRAVLLGGANQRVHPLRPVEFDPQDAVVLGFIQQIVDQRRCHRVLLGLHAGS